MACKPNANMEEIDEIVRVLRTKTDMKPPVGIICGSGLSSITDLISNPLTVPYDQIPGFPKAHVQGHGNSLVFGDFNGVQVVCMKGRFHFYSGYTMQQVVLGARVMAKLGVSRLIVTNAAGAINPIYNVGDVIVLADHINIPGMCGQNPLLGQNDSSLGVRFTPMSDVYELGMQESVSTVATRLGHSDWVRRGGIYAAVIGPSYETPAECRFLRMVGGDCVGMSTIPEVLAARHAGMRVLGLSLITNKVVTDPMQKAASHEEVLEAVNVRKAVLPSFVRDVVIQIGKSVLGIETNTDAEANDAKNGSTSNGNGNQKRSPGACKGPLDNDGVGKRARHEADVTTAPP